VRQNKVSLLPTRAEWTSVKKAEVQAPLHPEATESAQIIHSGNHKNVNANTENATAWAAVPSPPVLRQRERPNPREVDAPSKQCAVIPLAPVVNQSQRFAAMTVGLQRLIGLVLCRSVVHPSSGLACLALR